MNAVAVYLIAGEPSGDMLGGALLADMRRNHPELVFHGIGGERMAGAGLSSLFPMQDISLMGLAEILPHLRLLKRRLRETIADILRLKPDVLVTIDSPGFCLRIAAAVRQAREQGLLNTRLVHYVAPSVWAWKPKRAEKMAALYDHLLCLLPFEPPYFTKHDLAATFVGHPVVQNTLLKQGNAARFWQGETPQPLLCLLPGSRKGEIRRLLPLFLETAQALSQQHLGLSLALPTIPACQTMVQDMTQGFPLPLRITTDVSEKYDMWAASRAALAASGTVSLELAVAGVPSVIAYKVHPLTAAIVKRLVKARYVSLVNILEEQEIFPEYLQEKATVTALCAALEPFLADENNNARAVFEKQCAGAILRLNPPQGLDISQLVLQG